MKNPEKFKDMFNLTDAQIKHIKEVSSDVLKSGQKQGAGEMGYFG